MPYLPSELWLITLQYCEPKDIWLALRPVNRQLHDCVQQHFRQEILPQLTISLPIALPTYDIRQRLQGKAIFHFSSEAKSRACYVVSETEPSTHQTHFMAHWDGLQDAAQSRLDGLKWDVNVGDSTARIALRSPRATMNKDGEDKEAALTLEWPTTITALFLAA